MNRFYWFLLLCSISTAINGQELFNMTMPASTIPKNALVIQGFSQWYGESEAMRGMAVTGFSYGLTKNLMIRAMLVGSNHHDKYLPENLVTHSHTGGGQVGFSSFNAPSGQQYEFRLSGINIYGQWRFLAIDGYKKHFRMAAFAEFSNSKSAHDEAEITLWDDNSGYGIGIISTYLKNRMALSMTVGFLTANDYEEMTDDGIHTILQYSNAYQFDLSFGYLLSPKKYISYSQRNTNIYIEVKGKRVEGLSGIFRDSVSIPLANEAHQSSFYVEVYPGIQRIYNSTTRLEFSVGLPVINRSYSNFYPLFMFGVRHYLFL